MNNLPVLALADHGLEVGYLFFDALLMKVHVFLNLPLGIDQHEAEETLQLLPEELRLHLKNSVPLVEVLFVILVGLLHVIVSLLHRLEHEAGVVVDTQYLVTTGEILGLTQIGR